MTLYNFIMENKNASLIFGPGEIRIIKKQLKGVNLTQSEKNRLSRSIRPKLKLIRECALYKDEFDVKKGGEIIKQMENLRDELLRDKLGRRIKKIYLFGSFVENKMSMDSDVDVAIEFDRISKRDASLFKKRIIAQAPSMLDISVFNMLSDKFKQDILKNGKIFYSFE
ncbi:MAG: nucleotidyltransferase family protein [Candidatus Nanoarchaeia archaeon]